MNTWLMRRPVRSPVSRATTAPSSSSRVQAALHQQLGLALANQLDRLRRRGMAVRRVDDPRAAEIDAARARDLPDLRGRARRGSARSALARRPRSRRPAPSPRRDARPRSAPARGCGTSPAAASYFPVPVVRVMVFLVAVTGAGGRAAGPVSFRKNVRTNGQPHAVQQRRERRLVVLERASARAPPLTRQQDPAEDRRRAAR